MSNTTQSSFWTDLPRQIGTGALAAGVFGGDYSGRYMGIRLPGLVLATHVDSKNDAYKDTAHILDAINARYRWGLIPRDIQITPRRITMVESTANTGYAKLAHREHVGYTACDDWFVLGSNIDTLMHLIARYDRPEAIQEARVCSWADDIQTRPCDAYFRLDLIRGGKTIRTAIAAYSLKLLFDDADGNQNTRRNLKIASEWTKMLDTLEVCRLWFNIEGNQVRIDISIGSDKD